MTQPTPDPTTAGVAGMNFQLPQGKSSSNSKGDLYGLGDWGSQVVDPGDLPILFGVIKGGQQTTGDVIVKAFAAGDPGTVATIQNALYLGGFYGTNSKYKPTYGVVSKQDVSAFGNAVILAGQSHQPVSQVLLASARYGAAAGIAAAQALHSNALAKEDNVAQVNVPATSDLAAALTQAFQDQLGRKPTQAEAAAFASTYQAMAVGVQRANNQAVYNATTAGAASTGLTAKQAAKLDKEVAGSSRPVRSTTIKDDGSGPLNERVVEANQTPSEPIDPSFDDQMMSLGAVAQQVQQEATPIPQQSGLNQVDQESVEDPSVAAENYARNTNPHRAAAHDLAQQFDNFLTLLGQNFGG